MWRISTHNMRLWKKPEIENEEDPVDFGYPGILGIGHSLCDAHQLPYPDPGNCLARDTGRPDLDVLAHLHEEVLSRCHATNRNSRHDASVQLPHVDHSRRSTGLHIITVESP